MTSSVIEDLHSAQCLHMTNLCAPLYDFSRECWTVRVARVYQWPSMYFPRASPFTWLGIVCVSQLRRGSPFSSTIISPQTQAIPWTGTLAPFYSWMCLINIDNSHLSLVSVCLMRCWEISCFQSLCMSLWLLHNNSSYLQVCKFSLKIKWKNDK